MRERYRRLVMFDAPGNNDGGGAGAPQGRLSAAELLARYGASPERLAAELELARGDNYTLREQKRGLTTELESLRARVPGEGAIVLTGDDAAAWGAFKELGKPDEVKAKLGQVETLSGELAGLKRDATLRDVAGAAGYKFTVLKQLGADREYELRDVTDPQGKAAKAAFIKDGDTFKPLAEFAQAAWADFLPALQAGAGQGGGTGGQGGTQYPPQGGGTGATGKQDAASAYLASQRYAVPKRQTA